MAWVEFKINLERVADAIERLATAVERIAEFLVPKPVERPAEKAKPRGAVHIISNRDLWQRQQLLKILRAQGLSRQEIAEKMNRLRSEDMEEDFPPGSEETKPLSGA